MDCVAQVGTAGGMSVGMTDAVGVVGGILCDLPVQSLHVMREGHIGLHELTAGSHVMLRMLLAFMGSSEPITDTLLQSAGQHFDQLVDRT